MTYFGHAGAGSGDLTPDPAPSWWRPSLGPVPNRTAEEIRPREIPDNRTRRRDRALGRTGLGRALRRGFHLPWYGDWPPVWRWDVVPFLRLRCARSEQSMHWALGVVVVGIGSSDDQWTVTVGHRSGVLWLWILRGLQDTDRELLATQANSSLRLRRHISIQPTHAP